MDGTAKDQRTHMGEAEPTKLGSCREDGGEGEGEQSNRKSRAFLSLIRFPNNSLPGKSSCPQREMEKFHMQRL